MGELAEIVSAIPKDFDAGVLLIDHNMALVMEVCDRIHVLDQGRTLAEGTPAEIRGNLDVDVGLPRRERGRRGDAPVLELEGSTSATAPCPRCAASASTVGGESSSA